MVRYSGFIDNTKIYVKAGDGGSGCLSFRREKFIPKGGPNGGNGGKGGDVILEGEEGLLTLLDFRYHPHLRAKNGNHGMGKDCDGRKGEDFIMKVPLGTIIKDIDNECVIGEILVQGQRIIIANGGRGGRGNKTFASSTNRAPRRFEKGFPGEEKKVFLELKLIADVGLVGAPNAGKSTLINAISESKSKVGGYPFTTLNPALGVVQINDRNKMVIADMPGLIEGASIGKGLGDKFLRHIERTKILVFVIDMSASPIENYQMLREEMRQFNPSLCEKPFTVAANKMDIKESKANLIRFKKAVDNVKIFQISALKCVGINTLIKGIWKIVKSL